MKNTYKLKTFTKITMTAIIAVVFLFLLSPSAQADSKPRVYTRGASNIWVDSAVLNGQTLPRGSGAYAYFEWGLSADNLTNKTSEHYVGGGDSYIKFSALISGFSSNTKYYFRAVARNSFGVSYGPVSRFTTRKVINTNSENESNTTCSLLIDTGFADGIGVNLVTLNGKINPKGRDAYGWFSYGKTASLGSKTLTEYVGNNNKNFSIEKQLNNLEPNTTYYYKIVAQNDCGIKNGSVAQFTTQENNEVSTDNTNNTNNTNGARNTGTTKIVLASGSGENIEGQITSGATQLNNLLVLEEIVNTTFPNGTKGINSSFGGDIIEYTLLVKNIGIFPVYNVVVRDELSEQFDLVESIPDISYLSSGNSLIWNVELIKPSETKEILLRVKAKPVEESVLIFNNFTAETDEYIIVSKKIATVLNPVLATPKVAVDEDGAKKGIVASVFSSVRDGLFRAWLGSLVFSLVLFIIIFFVFSLVFLLYKTQEM